MLPRDNSPWLVIVAISLYSYPTILAGFNCLSNPCVHGVCIDDLNTTYSCYCIDGYTGIQCQTNWDECWSNPCQNGGICHDGIAAFNCSCPSGFIGEFCEEDYDECDSNPCLNNGSCIDITNGYSCSCPIGYSGTHCEIDEAVCNATNETRCINGGICEEGPGLTFSCRCRPGWAGFFCQMEIDECMSAPCQNGGVCLDHLADYACACLFGYTGKNCEEIILHCEDNPCENGALCLTEEERPVCYCVPDYHGDRCQYQYDECQLGIRCMNGGTCIDGVDSFSCSCPQNLTGSYCECLIIGENQLDCTYIITTGPSTLSTTETITEIEDSNVTTSMFTRVPNIPTSSSSWFYSTENQTESTFSTVTFSTSIGIEFISTTETATESYKTTSETVTTDSTTTTEVTEKSTTVTAESATFTEIATTSETLPTSTQSSTAIEYSPTFAQITTTISTLEPTSPTETSTTEQTAPSMVTTILSKKTTPPETATTEVITVTTFLTEEPITPISTMESEISPMPTELTTFSRDNVTDCTRFESACQNGGTCVYTSEGYKCVCPYDAEGVFCEINLGIKNAAFGGDSYLTHRLINTSTTELEFTTKTLSPGGLIFYTNIDKTYMALYLENGYLKFIFSCGYQTMLLSELRNPINNGFDMTMTARLEFSKDYKRCNASVMINNTLSMSGNQISVVNQLIRPISTLHLGGLPHEKLKEQIPSFGFMGCITGLKISGKKVDIFKDAEDGFKISECASLACLSSPCNNGGTCIENDDEWYCHCKNGYLGKLCENSVCDNNPCLFGATCLPFTGNGYICLCPFGKHGHFCENELETSVPYFSSSIRGFSSYAAYPIPIGGISSNMELKFHFVPATMDQISILMFIGQEGFHDATSDHIAVSFVKGYIMLTWNLGSGPRRIFTARPLQKAQSTYMLRLGRFGRRAWLSIDNFGNITGRSPGYMAQLDVVPILYIGGHNSPNFSTLPHDLPLHTGFSGCIFDVELKSGDLIVPLQTSRQVVGRSVGQCGTTECHEKLCHNNGACLHHGGTFTCLCQDGWFGPLCSSKYNPCNYKSNNCTLASTCVPLLTDYECDCPVEKSGKFCDKDETLSDVSLLGKRSYVSLKMTNFEISKFVIEIQLRPLSDRGLILFIGDEDNSFLSLTMHSGLLELKILPEKRRFSGNEILSIRSNKLLAMGVWYRVRLGKFGNKVYLYTDNVVNTALLRNGDVLAISGKTLYLGGLPDLSRLPRMATSSLPIPFTGCVRQLTVNSQHIPLTKEYIMSSRNVADCDGTPCGSDVCENGGSCWLDSDLKPHCSCEEPYFGEKCERTPSCKEKSCQNKGRCVNRKCSCIVGYTGAFCETAITIQVPEFSGNSHLILKRNVNDKKRDLSNTVLKYLELNFTTAEQDGLILWIARDNSFIGIGLEKGYLKLAQLLNNTNKTIVNLPPSRYLADGLRHSLTVSFELPYVQVYLDRKLLHATNRNLQNTTLSANTTIFLGGLPVDHSILRQQSYGLFPDQFEGCIKGIAFNGEKSITDFSAFEGENVGICST